MPPRSSVATLDAALIEETAKRSAVVWIDTGFGRPVAAWHVWRDGAVHVVCGGGEQELPGLTQARIVQVIVRSKDSGARLMRWQASVTVLRPPEEAEEQPGLWASVTKELAAKRLNAVDAATQPQRWALGSAVVRLTPTGSVGERPAYENGRSTLPSDSLAAPPPRSPATTVTWLPWVLTGKRGVFRRLARRIFGRRRATTPVTATSVTARRASTTTRRNTSRYGRPRGTGTASSGTTTSTGSSQRV